MWYLVFLWDETMWVGEHWTLIFVALAVVTTLFVIATARDEEVAKGLGTARSRREDSSWEAIRQTTRRRGFSGGDRVMVNSVSQMIDNENRVW